MAKDTRGLTNASTAITLGSSGQGPVILPEDLRGGGIGNYTTVERNAISGQRVDNNMLIYNTTTSQYERYSGGTRAASGFMTGGTWAALDLSEGGHTGIQTYADNTAYAVGNIVLYTTNNSLYYVDTAVTDDNTTDPDANSNFTRISNPVDTTYTGGTGITISGSNVISVNAMHAAETVVFEAASLSAGITARNAARAAGWSRGDIAIITDDDPDSGTAFEAASYIYIGANNNTAATTDSDWAHLTFTTDTVDVVSNVATNTILGRNDAGSGDSEELTPAEVRTMLNVADGATNFTLTRAGIEDLIGDTGTLVTIGTYSIQSTTPDAAGEIQFLDGASPPANLASTANFADVRSIVIQGSNTRNSNKLARMTTQSVITILVGTSYFYGLLSSASVSGDVYTFTFTGESNRPASSGTIGTADVTVYLRPAGFDTIPGNNIIPESIASTQMDATNTPTGGQILSRATDGVNFTWVDQTAAYTLPVADGTTLGGVLEGGDIDISATGVMTIADNSVDAAALNVANNGTEHQLLASDGDGSFSWVTPGTDHGVGDGTITLGGDVTGDATFSVNQSADATIALTIDDNAVDAAALNVAGNGTEHQLLASDGDGSFSWVTPSADHGVYDTTVTLTGDVTDATFTLNDSAAQSVTLSLADNSVDNAAMADDAIGIAELSASGTASATTYLRGDNTWAGFDHVIPGLSDVFEIRRPAPVDAIQRAAALPESSLIGATPPYWRFWDGSSTPPTGLSAVVPSTWGGFFGTGSTYPFFVLSSSETRSDWVDGLNRNDARTLYAYRDATNWAVWTITGTTDPVDSVVNAFGGDPAVALTNDTGVTYTLANSMGTPSTGNIQWVFDFNSEGDVVDIILNSQDNLYLGNNGNNVEWRELPNNEIHIFSTTTAYATGDFVYYADRRKLYRVSSPIAASNTLTPNNNPSFQEVAGSLKTYSDNTPYAVGEIVYYFGNYTFYRVTTAIPASNTTDPNANSSFTKIHQFDLHEDVTTELSAEQISFDDHILLSDQSATGQPNVYTEFESFVGRAADLLDSHYEAKIPDALAPLASPPAAAPTTGSIAQSTGNVLTVSEGTGAKWGFFDGTVAGAVTTFTANNPSTWEGFFSGTRDSMVFDNATAMSLFSLTAFQHPYRAGVVGFDSILLTAYVNDSNFGVWQLESGNGNVNQSLLIQNVRLVAQEGTPGSGNITWTIGLSTSGALQTITGRDNTGNLFLESNKQWSRVQERHLDASNTPTAGQVLTSAGTGGTTGFTWVDADAQLTRTNIEEQIGDTDILLTTAVFNNESDEVPTSPFDTSDLRFFDGGNPITERTALLSTADQIIFYPQTDTPMQDVLNRITTSSLIRLTSPAIPAENTDPAIPARSIIFRPTAVTLTPASNAISVSLTTASTIQITDGALGRLFGFTPSANWTVSVKLDSTLIHGDEIIPNTIGYDRLSTAAVAEIREGVQTDNPRLVVEAFRQAEVKTITYNTDGTIFTTLADVGFSAATDIRAYYTYTGDNLTQVRYFDAGQQNSVDTAPAAGAAGLLATKTLTYTGDNITTVAIT